MKASIAYLAKMTDAQLIKCYLRGNSHALEVLFTRHEGAQKKYLHTLLHNREWEKDAWQEVQLDIIKNLTEHKYHEQGIFLQWLRGIVFKEAKATLVSMLRQRRWRPARDEADNSTEESIFRDERMMQLWPLIEKMGSRTQTIISMRIKNEMEMKEIAGALQLQVATVYTLFNRAVAQLARQVSSRKKIFNNCNKISRSNG